MDSSKFPFHVNPAADTGSIVLGSDKKASAAAKEKVNGCAGVVISHCEAMVRPSLVLSVFHVLICVLLLE